MSASPIARQAHSHAQLIPAMRKVLISEPSQMPDVYSSTPNGTLYSTTPGGMEFFPLLLSYWTFHSHFIIVVFSDDCTKLSESREKCELVGKGIRKWKQQQHTECFFSHVKLENVNLCWARINFINSCVTLFTLRLATRDWFHRFSASTRCILYETEHTKKHMCITSKSNICEWVSENFRLIR